MKKEKIKILIIDDDPKVSWLLSEGMPADFEFVSARDGSEGIQMVTTERPDLVLLDIKMPGISGLEVLEKLSRIPSRPEIIMLSGQGETDIIAKSKHLGAAEFIHKPFEIKEIEIRVQAVLEAKKLREEVKELKSQLKTRNQHEQFIGDSPKMMQVKSIVEQVAGSELTVLIRGESGTGKEIIARMLHNMSSRADEPFTKVNCAAIPRDLLEAELFGYEKGAFTGAHKTKPGRFEVANKGSIFLDEIGDMPLELQSKLLQVLEQQEFVRVGGIHNIHVDVRIVCATNKNLEDAIRRGGFRDDLFYRLNEITVFLPPLRQRHEDIPLLVNHFLKKYGELYQKETMALSVETIGKLLQFTWPGNVRQLENLIKQVVVRGDESIVNEMLSNVIHSPEYVPSPELSSANGVAVSSESSGNAYSLKHRVGSAIANEERRLISEVLTKTNWNRRKAADLLEISYRSLLYKIKEYNLNSVK